MEMQLQHGMLARPKHDEFSRQRFCQNMRAFLLSDFQAGTRAIYEARVRPAFKKSSKCDMKSRHEIRREMNKEPFYRLYCASLRGTQELMWDAVIDSVERELPRLKQQGAKRGGTNGTVEVDPALPIPRYHTAADIHLQPGAYHTEVTENDVAAGAVYDRGVFIYGNGKFGPLNDFMGNMILTHLKEKRPDFHPETILDMGCSVGHSTLPYVDAFPEATVYGIDIGAPMVRYAHGRAEALRKRVHFSQQNAEHTNFADNSMDLIVSHILFHETSRSAFKNILKECRRLLRPGGIMLHLDIPQNHQVGDMYDSFLWDWEAYNNNETFCVVLRDLDYEKEALAAGFAKSEVGIGPTPFGWPILIGQKLEK